MRPTLCLLILASPAAAATPEQLRFFEAEVRPLLVKHCHNCHGPKNQSGGLRLDTADGFKAGGDSGSLSDGRLLLSAVRHEGPEMPPKKKIPDADLAVFTRWVKMGAPWPAGGVVSRPKGVITADDRAFWAFQPLMRVKIPAAPHFGGSRPRLASNPIDAFLLARLEAKGLAPAPPADRRTLVRRLTYGLAGLPPTPEEVETFINDSSPDAYGRLVERLLAAPAFGERWGRHWLDVVRYADTAGDNSDYPVPQAYRYRDWVIQAANDDMPFDAFTHAQIAGDLLPGSTDAQKIATGYLAGARRFGSYEDKRYQWWLTYEDTIENMGRAFLGLGLSCSRCHDHKFDPIFQDDYYALYGIFRGTRYPWPGIELDKKPRDLVTLSTKEQAYAVEEGKRWIGDVKIHLAGDPTREGKTAPRRFLRILGGQALPADEKGSGRLHLARWLTSNPLFARVIVNRVWRHHFGRGFVATPNDFGRQGRPPSHPELLDHLATRLVESGWSLKALHRLVVTSSAYRMGGDDGDEKRSHDPDNELLSRSARRRLDAEQTRDTLLILSGHLDRTRGGGHPFPPAAKWGYTQHAPFKAVYETDRRGVYLMAQRIQRHPYLALFDGADTNASTGGRPSSTTPLQALYLMNDPFVTRAAKGFAARLMREKAPIDASFLLALGRPPTDDERAAAGEALAKLRRKAGEAGAWEAYARALFMTNELAHVD